MSISATDLIKSGSSGDEAVCDCGAIYTALVIVDGNLDVTGAVKEHPEALVEANFFDLGDLSEILARIPPNPLTVFTKGCDDLWEVWTALQAANIVTQAAERIVLVQFFSIMEAYLSDRLVKLTAGNREVQTRLVQRLPSLRNMKFDLIDLANQPDLLTQRVVSYLKNASFHDLKLVNQLYLAACDTEVLPKDKSEVDFLLAAVKLRHDCVHRNGQTQDGTPPEELSEQYLRLLSNHFTTIAANIDSALSKITTKLIDAALNQALQ